MASNRLSIFDIIADLIPGIVFLVMIVPRNLFNSASSSLSIDLSTSIILLAIGYTSGRIIHTIAARPRVEWLMSCIGWLVAPLPLIGSNQLEETRNEATSTIETFKFAPRLSDVTNDNKASKNSLPLEHDIIAQLIDDAAEYFNYDFDKDDNKTENSHWESDFTYLEHLGQSLVHTESSLYHRYTILSTFYRNLWVAILLGGVGYAISSSIQVDVMISLLFESLYPAAILISGLVILIVLPVRWLEFRYRRLRTFINDLYLQLNHQSR